MSHYLMRHFSHQHLPPNLAVCSAACGDLARIMDEKLPECAEKTAGLRKLLEAKDCFVRALLEQEV
jgi:hypothetical protein